MSPHRDRLAHVERLARELRVTLEISRTVRHANPDYDPGCNAWGVGGQWCHPDWIDDDGPRGERGRVTVSGWDGSAWAYFVALHELGHCAHDSVDEHDAWAWAYREALEAPDALVDRRRRILLAEYGDAATAPDVDVWGTRPLPAAA